MSGIDPLLPLTLPDRWREQLDASRGATGSEAATELWNRVRRQFRAVTTQTRALLRSPLEFPVLQQLADRALQLSQIAFAELTTVEQPGAAVAAPELLTAMLDENQQLLDALAGQQRLLAEIQSSIDPLHAFAAAALLGELPVARWLEWTDELRTQTDPQLPLAGVLPEESLARARQTRPRWSVQALGSARLAARVSDQLLEHDPCGVQWLTAAALLQDIGLWMMEDQPQRNRRGLLSVAAQHPAFGAAILEANGHCPAEIAMLVGAHEERLDGTGLPRRLSGRQLSRRAQVLSLIARFAALAYSPACHTEAAAHDEPLPMAAGVNLWRDVRRGGFDENLALRFLEALTPGLSERVAAAFAARAHLFVDRQHAAPEPHRPLRQTAPAAAVPAPMFVRRRQGTVRLAYPPDSRVVAGEAR